MSKCSGPYGGLWAENLFLLRVESWMMVIITQHMYQHGPQSTWYSQFSPGYHNIIKVLIPGWTRHHFSCQSAGGNVVCIFRLETGNVHRERWHQNITATDSVSQSLRMLCKYCCISITIEFLLSHLSTLGSCCPFPHGVWCCEFSSQNKVIRHDKSCRAFSLTLMMEF